MQRPGEKSSGNLTISYELNLEIRTFFVTEFKDWFWLCQKPRQWTSLDARVTCYSLTSCKDARLLTTAAKLLQCSTEGGGK